MAKYHIKKDGMPGVCRAQDGKCPLGGNDEHFPTKEEAQNYADKKNEAITSAVMRYESLPTKKYLPLSS